MVLSTHAVVGAALANIFPAHPLLGFTLGFASHFALDAIPHWHYHVGSIVRGKDNDLSTTDMVMNRHLPVDLLKIGTDGMFGIFAAFFLLGASHPFLLSATLLGAIGGMLPDALQFVYWKWKHEPLVSLQHFHHFVHAKTDLNHMPFRGPLAQVVVALVCVVLVKFW